MPPSRLAGASIDGTKPELLLQSIGGRPEGFMKSTMPSKNPRLRLDSTNYRELYRQVLERDGWRCQVCGTMQNLQVNHLKFRSQVATRNRTNHVMR